MRTRTIKRVILHFLARQLGKALFAVLHLDGLTAMTVIDPSTPETLMEFGE